MNDKWLIINLDAFYSRFSYSKEFRKKILHDLLNLPTLIVVFDIAIFFVFPAIRMLFNDYIHDFLFFYFLFLVKRVNERISSGQLTDMSVFLKTTLTCHASE